jgi:hypothetical protein
VLDSKAEDCRNDEWFAAMQEHMDRNDDAGVFRMLTAGILESYRTGARFERIQLFAALEGHELGLAHYRRFAAPIFEGFATTSRAGSAREQSVTTIPHW